MNIKCEICGTSFPCTKVGSAGQAAKICDNPECAKIKSRQYYLKWKAAHPEMFKKHQHAQYERRRKDYKQPEYISKAIPKAKSKIKHYCQRCGVLLIDNRINCPACLTFLTDRNAGDEWIFMDGDFEDINPDYSAAVDKHFWDLV